VNLGSSQLSFGWHGKADHMSFHFSFSSLWCFWFSAAQLLSSCLLRMGGSVCCGLESPHAALLASSSTFSLPLTPLCPDIQAKWNQFVLGSALVVLMFSAMFMKLSMRY